MIFRQGNIFDHTALVVSILKQIEERVLNFPPANKAISIWVNQLLLNGYVVVAEEEGIIVGTIGMSFTHFPWNDEVWIMNNDWFYVDEEYRSGDTAAELISMVKAFADEKNLIARFDIINDKKVEKIDRFLQIKGMRYMGGNFTYGMREHK